MTARTHFEPPGPVRRTKPTRPTITTRPHTVHVIGTGPQLEVVLDSGPTESVHIVKLTRDMCVQLRDSLGRKLAA